MSHSNSYMFSANHFDSASSREKDDTMLMSEADDIFRQLCTSLQSADKILVSLYTDMITKAVDYAGIRSEWLLLSPEEKKANKEERTLLLDTFIFTINELSGEMESRSIPISWRDRLGSDRRRIGDWACYLSLFYSLNSR
ncbi:MAG: hypothetical protein ACOYBC_06030 [Bilifractor sp.]|jgi:hypothetical protein